MVNWKAFEEEMDLDKTLLSELYHCFGEELRQDIAELEDAAQNQDFSAYARTIHKIKGTAASYRAEDLKVLVTEIDELCKLRREHVVYGRHADVVKGAQDVLGVLAQLDQIGFED